VAVAEKRGTHLKTDASNAEILPHSCSSLTTDDDPLPVEVMITNEVRSPEGQVFVRKDTAPTRLRQATQAAIGARSTVLRVGWHPLIHRAATLWMNSRPTPPTRDRFQTTVTSSTSLTPQTTLAERATKWHSEDAEVAMAMAPAIWPRSETFMELPALTSLTCSFTTD